MSNSVERAKVLERVRKLLRLSENDAAADGEIRNAMEAAANLISQYQIDRVEIEKTEEPEADVYGSDFASFNAKRSSPWMGTLAMAIARAVGSVQCYSSKQSVAKGVFARPEIEAGVVFYGPEGDVALARALFGEWLHSIATITLGRYGAIFTGEGRAYAMGFASALYEIAGTLYQGPTTKPLPGSSREIVPVASVLAEKRANGSSWLRSQGVKLGSAGRTRVSTSGAYSEGRADGKASGFGVTRTRTLGGRS
ncbi:MAG: DUF2786 domain-containing protein [Pyrinomonadaceae bacterium]